MQRGTADLLHLAFIEAARGNWGKLCAADTTGKEVSFGRALTGASLLGGWVEQHCRQDRMVGVMLPATVGGVLANLGVLMAGKVVVNLNFTLGKDDLSFCIERCGIRTILTSRRFLEKAKLAERKGMVFLEDLLQKFGGLAKLRAMLRVRFTPVEKLLDRYRHGQTGESLATVIFSSGTTGRPKGVMLSHRNVLANIDSSAALFPLGEDDRVAGVLPFFHSFGFTFTMWFPLAYGLTGVYHPNPTEAQAVGGLVKQFKATFLLATPTYCLNYARKCATEQFASLRYVLVGAEKLRESVARAFQEKFDVELLEGYGCTEMAPVVAVNLPAENGRSRNRPGTVGQPIPNVEAKIVHVETGEPLPAGEEGLLLVNGPNRMMGYLDDPEKTANALRDGWYVTGDIGSIDSEGYITLTDRLARFSKIGGEMVPHAQVEQALEPLLADREFVVTGIPDEKKGERLVVLFAGERINAAKVIAELKESSGLPNLWLPKPHDLYQVEAIPVLGTGKLDLQAAKALARRLADEQGEAVEQN